MIGIITIILGTNNHKQQHYCTINNSCSIMGSRLSTALTAVFTVEDAQEDPRDPEVFPVQFPGYSVVWLLWFVLLVFCFNVTNQPHVHFFVF